MRKFKVFGFVALLSVAACFVACDSDDDNIVRLRSDGGLDATAEAADADATTEGGLLACGAVVPTTYDSPNFAANAKAELDLKARVDELEKKLKSAEGTGTAVVTALELQAIFTAGTPSLRSVATAAAQATVDAYITQFGDAVGKTWSPLDADADGGAASGGKFENANIFSPIGVDLREGILKNLLGGALYNHALALQAGPLTEATIDRFVVSFGATPTLLVGADAGTEENGLVAEYATKRDDKNSAKLGPYRKIRNALLVAKAAAAGGDPCRADLDAALATYFREWEKASYLTAIFYLNQASTHAMAAPVKGPQALHAFGEAHGFVQSFRGIPQDRRKITDAQIDALLQRIGAAKPYELLTRTTERVVAFSTAFQDIGAIYGLTQTEIEDAKKAY